MAGLLDFLQSASNAAASNVSGPVDLLSWLMRKGGAPVPDDAVGGSKWMEAQGLTKQVQPGLLNVAGETAGLLAPFAAAAKAPQIAKGLLQMGENAAAPRNAGMLGLQRGAVPIRFVENNKLYGSEVKILDDGTAVVEKPSGGFETFDRIRDRVLEDAHEKFGNKYDHFFRFTNNKDELALASARNMRNSTNFADNTAEKGLSVADGPHYGIQGYKYGYPLNGKVIGYGSDGEPLLDQATIEVMTRRLASSKDLVQQDKALLAKRLKELGLPADYFDGQVRALNKMP